MKLPPAAIVVTLAVSMIVGVVFTGWQMGSRAAAQTQIKEKHLSEASVDLAVKSENPTDQLQPFEITQDPPYGLGTPPEEMKALPTASEAAAHFGKSTPSKP